MEAVTHDVFLYLNQCVNKHISNSERRYTLGRNTGWTHRTPGIKLNITQLLLNTNFCSVNPLRRHIDENSHRFSPIQ